MAKSISVPLSLQGLERAALWLEDYANDLPRRCENIIANMLQAGESYAINGLGHIDTGDTLSTIMGYRNGNKGVIVANGAAIWIEFGTGVVKNGWGYNHPKAQELGMSAHGTYGEGHGASFNGWWYKGDDGEYHHTMGIPANRFMYNTAQMLRKDYPALAKEVFDK